jgi:drug/metabolite transporter (DMT)-like permease
MNTVPSPALPHDPRVRTVALVALFAGAVAIATAPLFVKVSETGPVATAFWRVFLALPFLFFWALTEAARGTRRRRSRDEWIGIVAAGLFFAGDLAVWHWSIVLTSVANSTLLANLAPIFVTLAAWLIFRQRPAVLFTIGLGAAMSGVAFLVGANFQVSGRALLGDALGVVTAMFYAAYQITVTRLRGTASTAHIMAYSSAVMAAALLPIALLSGDQLLPDSGTGWLKLFGLALFAQVAGQSLIAYAMAHLPATFSSVGLLLQPVAAALFAWTLLGETLGLLQMAGAVLVLAGIRIAHQAGGAK